MKQCMSRCLFHTIAPIIIIIIITNSYIVFTMLQAFLQAFIHLNLYNHNDPMKWVPLLSSFYR